MVVIRLSPKRKEFKTHCPPLQHVQSFLFPQDAADIAYKYVNAYRRLGSIELVHKHIAALSGVIDKGPQHSADIILVVFDIDATLLNETDDGVKPIAAIVDLFMKLQKIGAYLVLVTARLDDQETRIQTEQSLRTIGIKTWKELWLAPASARINMAAVSRWKHSKRAEVAKKMHQPIVLSVGDQWGDLIPLSREKEIDNLDAAFDVKKSPYQLVLPHDGYTMWGLKLLDKN
jgi:hypothetical protein